MAYEPPAGYHDAEVDRDEDCDRRDTLSSESPDEVPDERRRDDDRTWRDEPHRDRIEELPLRQPVVLRDDTLLQERHDREPAAEDERSGFQEEKAEGDERPTDRSTHQHAERDPEDRRGTRPAAAQEPRRGVEPDHQQPSPDEQKRDLGSGERGHREDGGRDDPKTHVPLVGELGELHGSEHRVEEKFKHQGPGR